jgi:type I restriction enzyme M protein
MTNIHEEKIKALITEIKNICKANGLGGDANEYKIVTQSFLYKFINDKFMYEVKKIKPNIKTYEDLKKLNENDYTMLLAKIGTNSAELKPEHLLEYLFHQQDKGDFLETFDNTLNDIAVQNNEIFSVHTGENTDIRLFDEQLIGENKLDKSKKVAIAKGIVNALTEAEFNFDEIFAAGFDFFSTLFEFMIKDYNKDGGGKYAEYYTPHSIAKVMAEILVGNDKPKNVTVYDPSAGSGTLLMNIAARIGTDKCTIYSQDITAKSTNLLRLNLILNSLSHSINNIINDDTILHNRHDVKMNYIVSNPPFQPQTSTKEHADMVTVAGLQRERFPFGMPSLIKDKKIGTKMYIYLAFLQHIIYSLADDGKAAVVVPTGFITAQSGIALKIRQLLVDNGCLKGAVSMPSNIFATTGTSVSVLFIDKTNKNGRVVLADANALGEERNDGEKKRRYLSSEDEQKIINAFASKEPVEDFAVVLNYDDIKIKNYSFAAGQYFDIKIEYANITAEEFAQKMKDSEAKLKTCFEESGKLEQDIFKSLKELKYES